MKRLLSYFLLTCWFLSVKVYAQDATNFTQYFINPYSINPSYAGIEGRSALFLTYRKQWANISGGPAIANLSLHAPAAGGLSFGLNVTNDVRGILNNSGILITAAYTLSIDHDKFLRFGISAGGAFNSINLNEFDANDPNDVNGPILNDPAFAGYLDKNASLLGNVGLSVHIKSFHFGAALPNIFSSSLVSVDAFNVTEVKPFQSIIIHASNRFYFANDKHVFEPYLLYRINEGLPSQYEAAAVLHLNHVLWLGGSYKQDFGISALGGIKVQNFFLIGGSYSIQNMGYNELNSPSYEIQLSYIFGAKKKDKPVYSFVNSEKEKIRPHRKSASELIAERRKQEELEKKKQQEEAEKKQKEEEALAKKQEEQRKKDEAAALAKQEEQRKKDEAAALAREEEQRKQQVARTSQQEEQRRKDEAASLAKQEEERRQQALLAQQQEDQRKKDEAAALAKQQEDARIKNQQQNKPPVQQPTQPVQTQPTQPPVVQQTNPAIQETQPVVQQPARHDGGPRLKSEMLSLDEQPTTYDTAQHETQARLARLDEHANNPAEEHGQDNDLHPNAERHEFVKKGTHREELELGDYVIAGVFSTADHAKHFSEGLEKLGFRADYGHLTEKALWYVYIAQSNDINKARTERDKYRKMKIFRDAWLLTVHE